MMEFTCFVHCTNQKAVSKGNKKITNTFLNPLQILKKIYHLEKHQRQIKQYTEKNYNILMLKKNRKNQITKLNQFSGHSKNTRECTQKLRGKKIQLEINDIENKVRPERKK